MGTIEFESMENLLKAEGEESGAAAAATDARKLATDNDPRVRVRRYSQKLLQEVVKKIRDGQSVIDVAFYLFDTYQVPIQLANKVVNDALQATLGQMDHSSWTLQYRVLGNELYKKAVDDGKIAVANNVLNNLIKLQYLTQSQELRTREQAHEEKKFEVMIKNPELGKAPAETNQGFRVQIESYSSPSAKPERAETPLEIEALGISNDSE